MITGITRVRNESLIIADTLQHFLGYCESVILYDDHSEDDTAEIAESFDRVTVIRGDHWHENRLFEETRHRRLLLEQVTTPWVLCFDADERLVGDLPHLAADGYRFRLFDGYLTEDRKTPYTSGQLSELPRMWGVEHRDILFLFRKDAAVYQGMDKREPLVRGRVELADVRVRHFGKCLSVAQWQETCLYYSTHWPEPYRSKWRDRLGKAIHEKSDFGRKLFTWKDLMRAQSEWVKI